MPNYLTARQVRSLFWELNPDLSRKKIKDYNGDGKMYTADTRCAFVDFLDGLRKDNQISQRLADKINL